MAFSNLTIQLVNNSSTTLTLASADLVDAKQFCMNIRGGIFDNNGVFYPVSSILSIGIS
jgi:hypothetical protein